MNAAPEFATRVAQAVEEAVVRELAKGSWLQVDYSQRPKIDGDFLRTVYAAIDKPRIVRLVTARCEERVADAIFNSLATELANDVKGILSRSVLREEFREILRLRIHGIESSIVEASS